MNRLFNSFCIERIETEFFRKTRFLVMGKIMRTEDGYIVHKCLNGDSAAFELLVDKYKPSIYALAYSKLRNFHDAEDIAQEVFLKAYQKLRGLRSKPVLTL